MKVKTFSCTLKLPSKKTVAVDLPIPEANKENICDIAFPDVLGDVFDIANYPLVLSHFTLGMDINTLGQNYRIDIPAVELVYNYYNENALDVQTIEGKSLDLSVLGRTILLGKAVDRVELYNVSGVFDLFDRKQQSYIGSGNRYVYSEDSDRRQRVSRKKYG